ncbi:MAG TPA: hypothetical protein VGD78_01270 [Chthoniobacterales bacterium]
MMRTLVLVGCLGTFFVTACTTPSALDASRAAMAGAIAREPAGNYFVGRRFYRRSYFFWGYVRKPREPWSSAQLVMLNEQKLHAPDREANAIGYDNNYEYRLEGYFSGDNVYEPASNRFYPEFVLTHYQQITAAPLPIFRDERAADPNRLVIDKPE